jgi:ParB family chromosome partitioning protein
VLGLRSCRQFGGAVVKHAVSAQTEAEILRLLLQDKMMGDVAQRLAMSRTRVESVANQYGWPDKDQLATSLAALDSDLDQDSGTASPVSPAHTPVALKGKTLELVAVEDLHPDPDNPRDSLREIEELAESITAVGGLIQPIVARRRAGRLIIVAGHRRLAAVQLLKWAKVEVIVIRDMPSDEVLAQQLVENGQRAGLDPIEEARALNRLKSTTGATAWELGRKIGRSTAYVYGRLALLSLSPSDQDRVRSGELPIGQATEKARTDSGTAQGARSQYAFHLGAGHPLASKARGRCRQVHGARARMVGTVACGECWETVIRSHERALLHTHSAQTGRCALCQSPVTEPEAETPADEGEPVAASG